MSGIFYTGNKLFPYLRDQTLDARSNELSVVVPIALHFYSRMFHPLSEKKWGDTLEIGSVLPNFHPRWTKEGQEELYPHLVVDPHRKEGIVYKKDIFSWNPGRKFGLILALGSLNQMINLQYQIAGEVRQQIFIDFIKKMRGCLTKDGVMMVAIPSYGSDRDNSHGWMDFLLAEMKERVSTADWLPDYMMKMNRMGYGVAGNSWREVDFIDGPNLPYQTDVPSAGTINILFWGAFHKAWWGNE